ncbi:MAG: septal ring lytic transglycosylase RlpA family protein [Bauldia sp.]
MFAGVVTAAALSGCVPREAPVVLMQTSQQCGLGTWYSMPGSRTANGDRMDPNRMTAAHRTLPFGTQVRVTNLQNGQSVDVVINDRGPFGGGRVIDLSRGAAAQIDMVRAGVVPVRLTVAGADTLPGC